MMVLHWQGAMSHLSSRQRRIAFDDRWMVPHERKALCYGGSGILELHSSTRAARVMLMRVLLTAKPTPLSSIR